jgi:hypothetical protein
MCLRWGIGKELERPARHATTENVDDETDSSVRTLGTSGRTGCAVELFERGNPAGESGPARGESADAA